MPAIGLFRGPMHVMEWANDELLAASPRDGRGMPAREAFTEEKYADVQAAMDDCFRSGEDIRLDRPLGVLFVLPRRDAHRAVIGVATCFFVAPRPSQPARPVDEPARAVDLPAG